MTQNLGARSREGVGFQAKHEKKALVLRRICDLIVTQLRICHRTHFRQVCHIQFSNFECAGQLNETVGSVTRSPGFLCSFVKNIARIANAVHVTLYSMVTM